MKLDLLDIAEASDDQIADAVSWLDGAWSRQTRALMRRFAATGLDINDSWAGEPCGWQCPCCKRTKSEIVRCSEGGVLLCHLELHHDHLRDWGRRVLRTRNLEPADEDEKASLRSAFRACKGLLERFYDTLICKDCNQAEGVAKKLVVDAPKDFSFSPAEIARFIKPRPHQQHQIDAPMAMAVWAEVKDDVLDRLDFVEVLASRITQGRHRRQGRPPRYTSGRSAPELVLALAGNEARSDLYDLPALLAKRSVRRDGFSVRRAMRKTAVRPPTDVEWAALHAGQPRTSGWRKAPVDWRCPACNRDRREIPRVSNANKWTAKLHDHVILEEETDWIALDWRGGWEDRSIIFGDHQPVWLCQDCRQVITDVKTRDPVLCDYSLTVEDLRELVGVVEAHTRPDVDLDAALRRARGNQALAEAAWDYFAHRGRCQSLFSRHKMAREVWGLSAEDAFYWLVARLEEEAGRTLVQFDLLEWELAEGERFAGSLNADGRETIVEAIEAFG